MAMSHLKSLLKFFTTCQDNLTPHVSQLYRQMAQELRAAEQSAEGVRERQRRRSRVEQEQNAPGTAGQTFPRQL